VTMVIEGVSHQTVDATNLAGGNGSPQNP
jgi:hypothetical protein